MNKKTGTAGSATDPAAAAEAVEAVDATSGEVSAASGASVQRTSASGKPVHVPPPPNAEPDPTKTWIEIRLVDEEGSPVCNERYRIELPGGTVAEGSLDHDGVARVEGIDPGTAKVTFPEIDQEAWEPQ